MNITKIDWTDRSWNPATGCLYKCPYCYARNQARRFKGYDTALSPDLSMRRIVNDKHTIMFELNARQRRTTKKGKIVTATFPFNFDPTFHRYRLDEPQHYKKPQNIFVCSMADLFGYWVPNNWIEQVFKACMKAPQHRYLFLTKCPSRYVKICDMLPKGDNFWFGTSITNQETPHYWSDLRKTFISIEPLLDGFYKSDSEIWADWVIIGAETGNRKGRVIPKREWIQNILDKCREQNVPVFMKDSLEDIWGETLIQEYPW